MSNKIKVIVVDAPTSKGGEFRVYEKEISAKESNFKKLITDSETPKICGCSLRAVFPGHTMRILDDGEPKQRRTMAKMPKWSFIDLEEPIAGNAVIFRLEASEPASVTITVKDVEACLLNRVE